LSPMTCATKVELSDGPLVSSRTQEAKVIGEYSVVIDVGTPKQRLQAIPDTANAVLRLCQSTDLMAPD
jgi:hypothetical protein